MAMNLFTCFSILLLTSIQTGRNLAIRIEINPEVYDKIIHKEVNITCTPDGVDDDVVKKIAILEIIKDDNKPVVVMRSGSQPSFPSGNQNRFVAAGHIGTNVSQSYLSLTLESYKSSDSGQYSCVMYFVDEIGLIKMEKSSLNLTEERLDVKTLENVLKVMKDNIDTLLKSNKDLQGKVFRNQEHITNLEHKVNVTTAFSASNRKSTITTTLGKTLILPDVIMRYGEGYDEKTGIFTSPLDGLYVFHVVVTNSRPNYGTHMYLRKNEEVIARLYAYDKNSWEQSSMTSIVHLKYGDNVFSVMKSNGAHLRHDLYTVFTGYLIHPF